MNPIGTEEEEPSLLDLVFSRSPEVRPEIEYLNPMGKCDHVVMEMKLQDEKGETWKENHKKGRLNSAKTNFTELKFFGNINQEQVMEGKTVQGKYEVFLEKYKEGVQKHVPLYRVRKSKYS